MTDKVSDPATVSERVICVVAKDILSLERRDLGLDDFLRPVWRGRRLLLTFIVIFGLAGIGYAFLAQKWYVAKTVLMPVSDTNMGGLTGQLGNLGVLTSLAGINLREGGSTDESLGVLGSRDFA